MKSGKKIFRKIIQEEGETERRQVYKINYSG
jgi:hypothetical protein